MNCAVSSLAITVDRRHVPTRSDGRPRRRQLVVKCAAECEERNSWGASAPRGLLRNRCPLPPTGGLASLAFARRRWASWGFVLGGHQPPAASLREPPPLPPTGGLPSLALARRRWASLSSVDTSPRAKLAPPFRRRG